MTTTSTRPVVATIDLPAGTIHDAGYETAAWYRTFEYDAQTVEVRLSGNFALYKIEGRTTHEHFPSLWGGVPTGGGTMGDCDKPSTYSVQTYDYLMAARAEAGEAKLTDDYRIRESFCDHPEVCSGSVTNYEVPVMTAGRYAPCEHDSHDDPHGAPITERNARGNLPHGYAPGVKTTKRHIKIVAR